VEKTSVSNSTWTRVIIVLLSRHWPHGIIPAERLATLNEPTASELRIKAVEMRERGQGEGSRQPPLPVFPHLRRIRERLAILLHPPERQRLHLLGLEVLRSASLSQPWLSKKRVRCQPGATGGREVPHHPGP
jgi:hypothetical protein